MSPNRSERAGALAFRAGHGAKRKFNEAGGGAWAGERDMRLEARSLLNKLEDKVKQGGERAAGSSVQPCAM